MKNKAGFSSSSITRQVTRITLLLLAGNLLQFSKLSAQQAGVTLANVNEAISLAVQNNPDLETYRLKSQKALTEKNLQQMTFVPSVSATATGQYNFDRQTSAIPGEIFGQPGQTIYAQFGTDYIYNAGLSANWTLFDFQNVMKLRIASLNTELQNAQHDAFRQKLTEQTSTLYFTILLAQQSLDLFEKDSETADSIAALSQEKFNQGMIDKTLLNQAYFSANAVRQNRLQSEHLLETALAQFRLLLGLETDAIILFIQKPESLHQELPQQAEPGQDKALRIYALQAEQSNMDIKLKRSAFYPRLSLSGWYGAQQLRNDAGMSFSGDAWKAYSYIGLNLTIPVFNQFAPGKNLQVARTSASITRQQWEAEKNKSLSQDAQLVSDYRHSLQQLELSEKNKNLAREISRLNLQKYHAGLISLDVYLRAFEDELKAQIAYLNAVSSACTSWSRIHSRP